ncbi:MAG: PKD domain-containing protein, partial [Sphingobacteriales bacterium]
MKRSTRQYLMLITLISISVISACKKSEPAPAVTPTPTPVAATRDELTKDSIFLYAKEIYYWNDKLPTYAVFNPRQYGTLSTDLLNYEKELFEISKYSNPGEYKANATAPKFSYIFDKSNKNPTAYVNPVSSVDLEGNGNDIGIRFAIFTYSNDPGFMFFIGGVYPGSPAETAGATRGDLITKINGKSFGANYDAEYNDLNVALAANTMAIEVKKANGNTATYTNGNSFNYLYTAFGTYQVKLVTVSANGCESDTARQTIVVGTVPVASFTMPSSVCMPDGVSFTNNSTVADGSTLTYAWNFGDPASGANNSSSATSPTHVYATAGSYTITLRATGGNGCFKDTVQVFDQFFDKPLAAFTVTPKELCQGADNVFNDLSTAPNSTISSRLWIFGDGSISTATNPTKRYSSPGIYEVKLVVTNAQGCVSDTAKESITVHLRPVIDAGPSFIVAQGSVIQLQATGNDNTGNTSYLWSPATGLSSPSSLTPQLTAVADQDYTLTATGSGNCTATDFIT